jgi:hypothetical protein
LKAFKIASCWVSCSSCFLRKWFCLSCQIYVFRVTLCCLKGLLGLPHFIPDVSDSCLFFFNLCQSCQRFVILLILSPRKLTLCFIDFLYSYFQLSWLLFLSNFFPLDYFVLLFLGCQCGNFNYWFEVSLCF